MKNTIIKYGLISGAIIAGLQLIMTLILKSYGFDKVGFDNSAIFGYTIMILAMAVIFFAVRAYRDSVGNGKVTFGKGLMIGLGIAAISCVCYSLMWLVVYYNFIPNFMDEYAIHYIDKLKSDGATEAELLKGQTEVAKMKSIYSTPLGVFAMTLIEPLPVAILISLVSAFILKKK
jgi:hypothetical protein